MSTLMGPFAPACIDPTDPLSHASNLSAAPILWVQPRVVFESGRRRLPRCCLLGGSGALSAVAAASTTSRAASSTASTASTSLRSGEGGRSRARPGRRGAREVRRGRAPRSRAIAAPVLVASGSCMCRARACRVDVRGDADGPGADVASLFQPTSRRVNVAVTCIRGLGGGLQRAGRSYSVPVEWLRP